MIQHFRLSLMFGVSATLAMARPAFAEEELGEQARCVEAYESAQEHRLYKRLQAARKELQVCMQDHCRDFIRSACRQWFEEVDAAIPSIVFALRQDGQDVTNAIVRKNGEPIEGALAGHALEMDPGKYTFEFEVPGSPPVSREIVLVEGERNRKISIELPSAAPDVIDEPSQIAEPPPQRSLALPIALTAVGAAGLGSFATFGLLGLNQERKLEGDCSPGCSDGDLRSVRTKYLIADISLGVGVVSLAVAGYLFLRPSERTNRPAQSALWRADVHPSPGGGFATVAGAF